MQKVCLSDHEIKTLISALRHYDNFLAEQQKNSVLPYTAKIEQYYSFDREKTNFVKSKLKFEREQVLSILDLFDENGKLVETSWVE